MTTADLRTSKEIGSLTAIRGVGALYVMLFHAYFFYYGAPGALADVAAPDVASVVQRVPFVGHGYLGVELFFVLSGYVMSYVYGPLFQGESWRDARVYRLFLGRRIARVYPLHAAVLTALLAYTWLAQGSFHGNDPSALQTSHPLIVLPLNYLLLQRVIPIQSLVVPAWSISVEMLAYAAFPLILLALVRGGRLGVLCAAAAAFLALGAVETRGNGTLHDFTHAYYPALRGLAEFSLGAIAFQVSQAPAVRRLLRQPALLAGAVVAVALLLFVRWDDRLTVAAFILLVAALGQATPVGEAIFGNRVMLWLGTISFSIYLVHVPLGPAVWYLRTLALGATPPAWTDVASDRFLFPLAYVLFAALVTLVASLTYAFIEVPARRALRRLFEKPAPLPAVGGGTGSTGAQLSGGA